jgi:hypothetical protein
VTAFTAAQALRITETDTTFDLLLTDLIMTIGNIRAVSRLP